MNKQTGFSLCIIGFCLFALLAALQTGPLAATAAERFPFTIPGDDSSPSATDMSDLSDHPAGSEGFVRIKDGHFYTDAGRLKIWGVNTCFGGNFPPHDEAESAAAHLSKLGINGLRVHHHDTSAAPRGLLRAPEGGERAFDPQAVDRLDYFLAELHKHGIYANLNLHVGRAFSEEEGFPREGLSRTTRYDKYLLYFEPRMRARFKEFCREYLTHYNPYRRLRRVDDPGIAMVEITNENSFSKLGSGVAAELPEPYREEFRRQWNAWLADRYDSTDAVRQAWGGENQPLGASLASTEAWEGGLGRWILRQSPEHPVVARFGQPGPEGEAVALRLDVSSEAPEQQMQELQFTNLALERGQIYTLSFWIKAAESRSVFVDISNQGPPTWGSVGFRETLSVDTEWRKIHRVFRVSDDLYGKARICFKFGGSNVDFSLAELTLRPGGQWIVLPEGQSLEARTVDIPVNGWSELAKEDARRFMVETEKGFIRDITSFLKEDLGLRVPVTASQITYHSAEIVAETCDYTDIHAYWQHPRFPRRPWDPVDWTIANSPMEASPDSDALLGRTPWRLLDRPFTISEWNIPDPNDYAASVVPFAAMVAALQDWDGVFFFQYHSNSEGWNTDKVNGYFSFNGQPVKLALLSACANLYRRGDLEPLPDAIANPLDQLLAPTLAISHRIGMKPGVDSPASAEAPESRVLAGPNGKVVWDASDRERAYVRVCTPKTRAVWGLIGGRSFDLDGITLRVGDVERSYAAVVLTSLDDRRIEDSERLLLAAVGSAENTGMKWNADRTSVGRSWGAGPAQVNGIPVEVRLPVSLGSVRSLDGRGNPSGKVVVKAAAGESQFSIGPEYRTLWYELSR